jgi:hypothetical protein
MITNPKDKIQFKKRISKLPKTLYSNSNLLSKFLLSKNLNQPLEVIHLSHLVLTIIMMVIFQIRIFCLLLQQLTLINILSIRVKRTLINTLISLIEIVLIKLKEIKLDMQLNRELLSKQDSNL